MVIITYKLNYINWFVSSIMLYLIFFIIISVLQDKTCEVQ